MKRNWSDLPADPLCKIADYLLEKEEYIDTYAACREVCTDWRCTLKVPEFHLNNWIMIDNTLPDVGDFTFQLVPTAKELRGVINPDSRSRSTTIARQSQSK